MKVRRALIGRLAACAVLVTAAAMGQASAPAYVEPAADFERFLGLVEARLALMEQVAAHKYAGGQPILDPAREAAVVGALLERGGALGLSPGALRPILELQVEWAREVQEAWLEEWRSGRARPPARVPDLATALRPEIDRLGRAMLSALYLARPALADPAGLDRARARATAAVRRLPAPEAAVETLFGRLRALRVVAAPALARISASGVLRVGTTGDYAPFSSDAGGVLSGIDIELAQQLAAFLGVAPRFVRTSWPALVQDLEAGRFDVAMSGISITEARRQVGDFSEPYHTGGKAPVARCGEVDRFDTLEEIDRPTTRVIVNPGGTNERFVRERLSRAAVTLHPDNRTVFDEIAAGRADVMVTDDIEVAVVTRRDPRLCRAGHQAFTRDDKAILMVRDAGLRDRIDGWLAGVRAGGEIERLFSEALR
jgi:cyclohexadienyl dehydratase